MDENVRSVTKQNTLLKHKNSEISLELAKVLNSKVSNYLGFLDD
jgi:hypothetical protein